MRRELVFVFAGGLLPLACRETPPPPVDAGPAEGPPAADAPIRATARTDAGLDPKLPLDPACEGMALALFEAARDEHCAVTSSEYATLLEARGLAQEARREAAPDPDGKDRVVFAIVNRGAATLDVPIRLDDRAPERVFTAVAQLTGDAAGLFALAPPLPELPRATSDAGLHLHSARIRLPPGGRASARLVVDPRVVERLDRGPDAGPPRGPVLLHIGQAFCPLDTGDPARVAWPALR